MDINEKLLELKERISKFELEENSDERNKNYQNLLTELERVNNEIFSRNND